jgi:alkanesulfonate monooxygenase SsuD/methylene tetrahydromethanopterin reductase-like flavin-dependent oxidoreductase (luciferase family)
MLSITLPHVDGWNVWWSDYGNSPKGFAEVRDRVEEAARAVGRDPTSLVPTAAVLLQLPGGAGRVMGDYSHRSVAPLEGEPPAIAAALAAMAQAGAEHLQLVLDPITRASIEAMEPVLAEFDRLLG